MENKVSVGTIVRTVLLMLALVNQILTATGHSIIPIDDETVTQLITNVATIVTALIAWWKDNETAEIRKRDDTAAELSLWRYVGNESAEAAIVKTENGNSGVSVVAI